MGQEEASNEKALSQSTEPETVLSSTQSPLEQFVAVLALYNLGASGALRLDNRYSRVQIMAQGSSTVLCRLSSAEIAAGMLNEHALDDLLTAVRDGCSVVEFQDLLASLDATAAQVRRAQERAELRSWTGPQVLATTGAQQSSHDFDDLFAGLDE